MSNFVQWNHAHLGHDSHGSFSTHRTAVGVGANDQYGITLWNLHLLRISRLPHCPHVLRNSPHLHLLTLPGLLGLACFSSCLTNKTFSVSINHFFSPPASLSYGVPHGSILSPILFSIYLLALGRSIQDFYITYHCYADDTQLYLHLKPNCPLDLNFLWDSLQNILSWMALNFLQLYVNRSEVVLCAPPPRLY